MKTSIDISTISEGDLTFHVKNSWCSFCQKADLGIEEPEFYTEDGSMYVSGNCVFCGDTCTSQITYTESDRQ